MTDWNAAHKPQYGIVGVIFLETANIITLAKYSKFEM
jgi:hypothetical protein